MCIHFVWLFVFSDDDDGFSDHAAYSFDTRDDDEDDSDEDDESGDDDDEEEEADEGEINESYGYSYGDRDDYIDDEDEFDNALRRANDDDDEDDDDGFIYDDTTPVNGKRRIRRVVRPLVALSSRRRRPIAEIKIDKATNSYSGGGAASHNTSRFDGDCSNAGDSILAADASMSIATSERKNSLGKIEHATLHFSLKPLHATGKKLELEMSQRIAKLNKLRDKSAAGLTAEQLYDEIHKYINNINDMKVKLQKVIF